MKKLTIILIVVIYVASVVVVGVFGLKAIPVDERYPVNAISFVESVDEDGTEHYFKYGGVELQKKTENGKLVYSANFSFRDAPDAMPINYNINPTNASDKSVDITVISRSADGCYELTRSITGAYYIKLNKVEGKSGSSVTLLIKAADGSGVSVQMRLTAWDR